MTMGGLVSGVITRRRLVGLALVLLLLAGMQGMSLSLKVKEVEPRVHGRLATDLRVTAERRYGFIRLSHGAVLVKARTLAEAAATEGIVGWTLFSLPLLMWGYGQPLYSD